MFTHLMDVLRRGLRAPHDTHTGISFMSFVVLAAMALGRVVGYFGMAFREMGCYIWQGLSIRLSTALVAKGGFW